LDTIDYNYILTIIFLTHINNIIFKQTDKKIFFYLKSKSC
jgi:hypothetical protein